MPHHRRNRKVCCWLYLRRYSVQIFPPLGNDSLKQPGGSLLDDLLSCKGSGVHFQGCPTNVWSNGNLTQGIFFKIRYIRYIMWYCVYMSTTYYIMYIYYVCMSTTDLLLMTWRCRMSSVRRHRGSERLQVRAAASFSWQPHPGVCEQKKTTSPSP